MTARVAQNPLPTPTLLTPAGVFAGMGDKLDATKGQTFMSGGFASLPGGMNHYAWATARHDRASSQERPIRDRLCQSGRRREAGSLTSTQSRRVLVSFLAIEY